ncbi:MAG: hypothetical protein ACRENE_00740, partial [Polyangiaceae bacterium]
MTTSLASLDTKAGRAFVVSEVNAVLARTFKGKVIVTRIAHLGLDGARGVEATIEDPSGVPVAHARVARTDIDTFKAIRSFLFAKSGPRTIELTDVVVDDSDLRLDTDASGRLDLLVALEPAHANDETEPATRESAREIRVALDAFTIHHARTYRTATAGPVSVDVDLDEMRGAMFYSPGATEVDLLDGRVRARKVIGGMDVSGQLRAHLRVPGQPGALPDAHVEWTGAVGQVNHSVVATLAERRVDVVLRSGLENGRLDGDLHGRIEGVMEGFEGSVALRARDVDLHALLPDAPPTRIGCDAFLTGTSRQVRFHLDADALPPTSAAPDLPTYDGVHIETAGVVDLSDEKVVAELTGRARHVAKGPDHVQSLAVRASVQGPLASPEVDAGVSARGVVAAGRRLTSVWLTARGSAIRPEVAASLRSPDWPDVDARAVADLGDGVALHAVQVDLTRAGDSARVTARTVKASAGRLRVEGGRVEDLGEPLDFSFALAGQRARLIAKTRGLDVGKACRIGHLEQEVRGGTLSLDTHLELGPGYGTGRVVLGVSRLTGWTLRDLAADVNLSVRGRTVSGSVHASAPYVGNLDVTVSRVTLGGDGPLTSSTWKGASGTVDVELRADLARLSALVPPRDLPVSEARGEIALRAHVERLGPTDLSPVLSLGVETNQLVLASRVPMDRDIDLVLVHPRPRWRLEGIDFALDAVLGGKAREMRAAVQAHDAHGELAELDLTSAHFPSDDILSDARRLERDLRTTDLDVALEVPERGLSSLPPILRQHVVTGRVRGEATLRGSLERPRFELSAVVGQAGFGETGHFRPMDVNLQARYDGVHAAVHAKAQGSGQEVLEVEGALEAAASDVLDGMRNGRWSGSARAHVRSFPLQAVAALDDKQIAGAVTGDVLLDGLHRDARLGASLSVDGLSVGGVGYRSARADFAIDAHEAQGSIRVDQKDGFLDASLRAPSSWGARILPSLERTSPLEGKVTAKDYRLAALLPFFDATFDELDGRLTTDGLRVELDPRTRSAKLTGKAEVKRGAIEAATAGGELHDLDATVRFEPDGTVTLDKLAASGVQGRIEAKGAAHLRGPALEAAHATITIPDNGPIPLTVGGVELGRVDGHVEVSAQRAGASGLAVKVDTSKLDVKLSQASATTAESLTPFPPSVRIGAHRGDPARFELIPLDGGPHPTPDSRGSRAGPAIEVHLGDVHVARGTEI